jgi:hypothetical protein
MMLPLKKSKLLLANFARVFLFIWFPSDLRFNSMISLLGETEFSFHLLNFSI